MLILLFIMVEWLFIYYFIFKLFGNHLTAKMNSLALHHC